MGSEYISYRALVNDEAQYSIWPANKPTPVGWTDSGKEGTETEVLQYIEHVWADMRPLSVRRQLERAQE
jgi:MbtH protein